MELWPLIPKNLNDTNHDVAYILRESFQDTFSEPSYSDNIIENVRKFNVTKTTQYTVDNIYEVSYSLIILFIHLHNLFYRFRKS